MDSHDTKTYTAKYTYYFRVQNGEKLSGIIKEDMTLTADKYWILENNVLIPDGVTVTVEPGTQIQFWSADPSNPYGGQSDVYLQVEGRFICEGTVDNPISIFPRKGYENRTVTFTCKDRKNILDQDFDHAYTMLKYTNIINGAHKFEWSSSGKTNKYFMATEIDHCYFVINQLWETNENQSYIRSIRNSIFENYFSGSTFFGNRDTAIEEISNNLFLKSSIHFSFVKLSETKNVYLNCQIGNRTFETKATSLPNYFCDSDNKKWQLYDSATKTYRHYIGQGQLIYRVFDSEESQLTDEHGDTWYLSDAETKTYSRTDYYEYRVFDFEFKNNAFLSNFNLQSPTDIRIVGTSAGHDEVDISGNYWGTTDPQLVKLQCYDADWNVSLNDLIQEPYLTPEDDMSEIYPFVTEAYLTDSDGSRIQTAYAGQTVTMHVRFNRDMAQDIQPMVTYGGASPFTDYLVSGSWATMREWTATIQIDPFIDLGKMYIRVKDAVADNDRWLRTGTDEARFFFNIEKSSAQAMALQGTGYGGSNELTWLQDDYETLAGYNLYRSKTYDSAKPVTEQRFTKINKSLIAAEECAYSDTDVEQGVDYYYYFTVVDTAFKESPASNVVMCTPIDTHEPVITHTPKTTAVPNEQIAINAKVTDNVKVESVTLYYRTAGSNSWQDTTMRKTVDSQTSYDYRAVISAYEVTGTEIEYYLTAYDGINTAFCGTSEAPYTITASNDHLYDSGKITKQPTCTTEGEIVYTCQDCGKVRTEVLPKKDHVYNKGVITEMNSCTENGTKVYTCINCGQTKTEVLQATGHNYQDKVVAPTCQHQGYTEHICLNCGDSHRDSFTPVAEHQYSEEVLEPATCQSNGLLLCTCDNCGDSYTRTIKATGHSYTDQVIPPTCQTVGYTEHTCETCGMTYRDSYTKKTEHHWDEGIVTVEATMLSSGIKVYSCIDCGASQTEILPPVPMLPLTNCSMISAETVTAGDELLLHAAAEGGSGQYKYAVFSQDENSDDWKTIQSYSANDEINCSLTTIGTTTICLKIQDTFGNHLTQYYSVTVTPGSPPVNTSTLSDTQILLGRSVTIDASAEGGSGDYLFAVYYKKTSSSTWSKVSGYTSTTAFKLTPKTAASYLVRVLVKDSSGMIAEKQLTLKVEAAFLNNTSTLSADQIDKGETVNIRCASQGGTGTVTYAVYYKKSTSSTWTKARGYSTSQTASVTPGGTGTYQIRVKAKDAAGQIVNKDFTLQVTAPLQNTSTLSSDSVTLGEKIKIRCLAAGGTAPYEYAVFYKKSTSQKWTTLHDYSTVNVMMLKPGVAMNYDIRVDIRDSQGQIASRTYTLSVTK